MIHIIWPKSNDLWLISYELRAKVNTGSLGVKVVTWIIKVAYLISFFNFWHFQELFRVKIVEEITFKFDFKFFR